MIDLNFIRKYYPSVELHSLDEVCDYFSKRLSEYDELYDYFKRYKFDSDDSIAEKLHSLFSIEIEKEDVHELLNLPFEKVYHCPECGGNIVVEPEQMVMKCFDCHSVFKLDENYICPICNNELFFDKESEKLICSSCGLTFSPQRFAKPHNNWLSNEVGDGWEKVTPDGKHHNASPLPKSDIYPNPYR